MSNKLWELWAASAAVRVQDMGPDFFETVDDHPGSDVAGFYRGFSTSFRLKPGKGTWFHFPLPTPSLIAGLPMALRRVSLLWEAVDAAVLTWATIHVGGVKRIELSPRASVIEGSPDAAFETPHGLKVAAIRTVFDLTEPVAASMGVQLCVFGEAREGAGTLRFYGAGAAFEEARSSNPVSRAGR